MKVILIRHPIYDVDETGEHITEDGKLQIRNIIPFLKPLLNGDSEKVILLASPAKRANQAIEIIAQEFNLPHKVEENLRPCSNDEKFPSSWLLELIHAYQKQGIQILVCVGHIELTNHFPEHNVGQWGISFTGHRCAYAEAIVLDLETKVMYPLNFVN